MTVPARQEEYKHNICVTQQLPVYTETQRGGHSQTPEMQPSLSLSLALFDREFPIALAVVAVQCKMTKLLSSDDWKAAPLLGELIRNNR